MTDLEFREKEVTFNEKGIQDIIKACVAKVLDTNTPYNHMLVSQWSSTIVESCIERLAAMGTRDGSDEAPQAYKYIVTSMIMQNNGAGFHTATSCFWDSCDGMVVDKMEGKHLYAVTVVYAVSL